MFGLFKNQSDDVTLWTGAGLYQVYRNNAPDSATLDLWAELDLPYQEGWDNLAKYINYGGMAR